MFTFLKYITIIFINDVHNLSGFGKTPVFYIKVINTVICIQLKFFFNNNLWTPLIYLLLLIHFFPDCLGSATNILNLHLTQLSISYTRIPAVFRIILCYYKNKIICIYLYYETM